jgi:D-sedoheptulose 7-phosphate isomerase
LFRHGIERESGQRFAAQVPNRSSSSFQYGTGTFARVNVQKRLRVMSLTDCVPFISALGNDWGYDSVFREQLVTNASPGDIAIAISGSGSSPNVIRAVEWAKENGLFTCGFTGFDGGKLKGMVDLSIHSPIRDMEIAENCHMIEIHLVVSGLRTALGAGKS